MRNRNSGLGLGSLFGASILWLVVVLAFNLAVIVGIVWVIVWVLRSLGVLPPA